MPTLALRFKEPTFREGIATYVTAMCRKYRVHRQDVDDLIQEALTKIIGNIGTYRAERADFDTWARSVAVNVVHRHLRDVQRYLDRFSDDYPNVDDYAALEPSPERCARRKQAQCELTNAAENLSSRQVDVLILHAVDGVSHREIGQTLGIEEGASQKCYQRARNHLAQCLTGKAFSIMPAARTGCDESISSNESGSFSESGARWSKGSHYAGQIAAATLAFLAISPLHRAFPTHEFVTRQVTTGDGHAMYIKDNRSFKFDEPWLFPKSPIGKLEPAPLSSVRAAPVPKPFVGKPAPIWQAAPLPPTKHQVRPSVIRPSVRKEVDKRERRGDNHER